MPYIKRAHSVSSSSVVLYREEKTLFVLLCFAPFRLNCSLFLNNHRHETLGVLNIDSLDVAVELLLGILLVVSPTADANA